MIKNIGGGGVIETFIKKIRPTFSYCALFFKWIQAPWENNPINPSILEKALNNYDVLQIIRKEFLIIINKIWETYWLRLLFYHFA